MVEGSALLFFLVFAFFSCKGQRKGAVGPEENRRASETVLTLLLSDYHQAGDREAISVIRDFKELQKFYSELNTTRKPGLRPPQVDFEENMLLVYFPDKGTMHRLSVLRESKDSLFLVEKLDASLGEGPSGSLAPFSIYLLPKSQQALVVEPHID